MKIIDLLNKIANGEEVPKKIKVSCFEFEWRAGGRYYENTTKGNYQTLLQDWLNNANKLNSEVEIIEEEKEIPEKLKDILRVDDLIPPVDENMYKIWQQTIKNQNKINSIIDYLKSKGE